MVGKLNIPWNNFIFEYSCVSEHHTHFFSWGGGRHWVDTPPPLSSNQEGKTRSQCMNRNILLIYLICDVYRTINSQSMTMELNRLIYISYAYALHTYIFRFFFCILYLSSCYYPLCYRSLWSEWTFLWNDKYKYNGILNTVPEAGSWGSY